jgi:hypothetical protein
MFCPEEVRHFESEQDFIEQEEATSTKARASRALTLIAKDYLNGTKQQGLLSRRAYPPWVARYFEHTIESPTRTAFLIEQLPDIITPQDTVSAHKGRNARPTAARHPRLSGDFRI